MEMYIANCTRQIQDFQFRRPESDKLIKLQIEIGGQIKVPGEINSAVVECIVEQHAPYGMVAVSELDRTRPFVGLCWSDKKISVDAIRRGLEHNTDVLEHRGRQIRSEAAVAINNAAEEQGGPLNNLEIKITEDNKDGKDREVDETITVNRQVQNGRKTRK